MSLPNNPIPGGTRRRFDVETSSKSGRDRNRPNFDVVSTSFFDVEPTSYF